MSDWDPDCPCGNDSQCTNCGAGTEHDLDTPIETHYLVVIRPGSIVSGEVEWGQHCTVTQDTLYPDGRRETRNLAWFPQTDIGRRLAHAFCDMLDDNPGLV